MHMTKTGGLREWFKGNGTNCIRIVPNSAVKFVTYNELSRCGRDMVPHALASPTDLQHTVVVVKHSVAGSSRPTRYASLPMIAKKFCCVTCAAGPVPRAVPQ